MSEINSVPYSELTFSAPESAGATVSSGEAQEMPVEEDIFSSDISQETFVGEDISLSESTETFDTIETEQNQIEFDYRQLDQNIWNTSSEYLSECGVEADNEFIAIYTDTVVSVNNIEDAAQMSGEENLLMPSVQFDDNNEPIVVIPDDEFQPINLEESNQDIAAEDILITEEEQASQEPFEISFRENLTQTEAISPEEGSYTGHILTDMEQKQLEAYKQHDKEDYQNIKTQIEAENNTNGVAQAVTNSLSLAYDLMGHSFDIDFNWENYANSDSEGKNIGEMLMFGGAPGDAWCVSYISYLYGDGQGQNFSETFSTPYANISVSNLRQNAAELGYYSEVQYRDENGAEDQYKPNAGDVMVIGEGSHVAMVINSDDEYIYTVEGNANDSVRLRKYPLPGSNEYNAEDRHVCEEIHGYIRMNDLYGGKGTPQSALYFQDSSLYETALCHDNLV